MRTGSPDRRRRLALALLLPCVAGCFGGHLVAAGRRRSEVQAVHEARATEGGIVVRTTDVVTDDDGLPLARRGRWIRIGRGATQVATVDEPPATASIADCDAGRTPPVPCLCVAEEEGELVLHVRDATGTWTVPARRLTATWTEPWVWALLPGALVVDVIGVPLLAATSPAVLVVGD